MAVWNLGAIFGLGWMIFFLPIGIYGTLWFWMRRDKQPIKARSPALVVITDVVLIGYATLLSVQRIVGDEYPCPLNLWTAFMGTVFLFNTYLWRCWTLLFTFHITQQRLLNKSLEDLPFFIRNRHYISNGVMLKFLVGTTLLLTVPPCIVLTQDEAISSARGDQECDFKWGSPLLAVYVVLYVIGFILFAIQLRSVVDGFRIKRELKVTGLIGVVAVIPWYAFNSWGEDINLEVFPFSTFSLIVAVACAFAASTLWPLYRSIFQPPVLKDFDIPEDLHTLPGLLSNESGVESFTEFLTKEFSVENILFYLEVEEFRKQQEELIETADGKDKLIAEAQRIYAKYIIDDCTHQVNLPGNVVQFLETTLKKAFAGGEIDTDGPGLSNSGGSYGIRDPPTVFDCAQKNIFLLMETDSCPRYFRSEQYEKFAEKMQEKRHAKSVLQEMQVL